ncbi:MAG: molybdopterin-dependent oxidoreductase, partial [Caldilinea sp.]
MNGLPVNMFGSKKVTRVTAQEAAIDRLVYARYGQAAEGIEIAEREAVAAQPSPSSWCCAMICAKRTDLEKPRGCKPNLGTATEKAPMITPDRIVSTTCPYCGVGCNLHLHVRDDFIYRVTSPHDAVVNQGNLCVKGRFGYDFMYHPDRVTTPLIRKTPQRPGARTQAFDRSEWRETRWDEALDYVADRLVEIYQRDGSKAMAVYCCAKATNEDNYLLQKMFRALFRTNNVDHCTRLCHAASVVALLMSLGTTAMSNTAAEVIHSDCFIVTGSNTTENHPIIALQMKEAVRKYGARLIVIDPRRLELCDFATLWLPLQPGANVPLFSAMAHVIVKEGLVNR